MIWRREQVGPQGNQIILSIFSLNFSLRKKSGKGKIMNALITGVVTGLSLLALAIWIDRRERPERLAPR
jgi:hypothetical protein